MKALFFLVLLPMASFAQTMPIPMAGKTCPLGYYISGSYCVPSSTNKSRWAVPKDNQQLCPLGAYASGNYCVKNYR